jgi:hypothetical protein
MVVQMSATNASPVASSPIRSMARLPGFPSSCLTLASFGFGRRLPIGTFSKNLRNFAFDLERRSEVEKI